MAKIKLVDSKSQSRNVQGGEPFIFGNNRDPEVETDPVYALFKLELNGHDHSNEDHGLRFISQEEQVERIRFISEACKYFKVGSPIVTLDVVNNYTIPNFESFNTLIENHSIIDLTDITNNAAEILISKAYAEKDYNPVYKSYRQYHTDRLSSFNVMPYSLYVYPYHRSGTTIKPFYTLPCYDEGVYQISKFRYLHWKIIGHDGDIYKIYLVDYALGADIWIPVRMGTIKINAASPYTKYGIAGERFDFEIGIPTSIIFGRLFKELDKHEDHPIHKFPNSSMCITDIIAATVYHDLFLAGRMIDYSKDCYKRLHNNQDEKKIYNNTCIFDIEEIAKSKGMSVNKYTASLTYVTVMMKYHQFTKCILHF